METDVVADQGGQGVGAAERARMVQGGVASLQSRAVIIHVHVSLIMFYMYM